MTPSVTYTYTYFYTHCYTPYIHYVLVSRGMNHFINLVFSPNLLLGAEHIYFPVPFGWGTYEMNTFVAVFQTYINEGKLSIIGQAWDGLEKFPSVLGIEMLRHNLKLIQIQTCLYYTKG